MCPHSFPPHSGSGEVRYNFSAAQLVPGAISITGVVTMLLVTRGARSLL